MNLKCFISFLFAVFLVANLSVEANAQVRQAVNQSDGKTKTVTGVVKDQYGEPLIGVFIQIKELAVQSVTDVDGNFTIKFSSEYKKPILTFSYIGMTAQEIDVSQKTHLEVVMDNDRMLDEVIITGIFTKAKESFTGAASMLTKEDMEMAGNRSILTSIQNLDPSFHIAENLVIGSDPNKLPDITMRGASSLPTNMVDLEASRNSYARANQPLFILDGFEISLEKFQDLDENLITSTTLLKDANATAMYGTKGSNGVIVITTRRPKAGALRITYRGQLNRDLCKTNYHPIAYLTVD